MSSILPSSADGKGDTTPSDCHWMCMAPFGSHDERCAMPTDHDGGRVGCNHAGGYCSDLPSGLGAR